MSAAAWLRVAAAVALLQFIAHGTMFVRSKPRNGPAEVAVVEAMRANRFNFAGSMRSYWDMYFGYGLFAAFFCLIEALLFWRLSGAASTAPDLVKWIVALFAIVNVAHIGLVARYFFFIPAVPDALIALTLAVAWFRL